MEVTQRDDKVEAALEYIRAQTLEYRNRDWFTRVRSDKDNVHERDWSGASAAGRSWAGSGWSGGREQ
jgi:hypothetical protein